MFLKELLFTVCSEIIAHKKEKDTENVVPWLIDMGNNVKMFVLLKEKKRMEQNLLRAFLQSYHWRTKAV